MSVTESHSHFRPTRSERRAATQQRLRDSGLELFAEHGLHAVTTHDIAHHAGLAAGTFYLHFSDKQALFQEIVLSAVEELREALRAAVTNGRPGQDRVRAHATALLDFASRNQRVIRILFSGERDAAALEQDVLNALADSTARTHRERQTLPPGAEPEVFAQALVGMFARVVIWWVENPHAATKSQVIETLAQIQYSGTQIPPQEPQ